jgi:alanyl-tRNA synthetase
MNTASESKIYYIDPYKTALSTSVTANKSNKKGTWYQFEKTIFYPEGGGQAADKGWVNDNNVLDVQKVNDDVWHLVAAQLDKDVELKLNWDYRYMNMCQHTGQHILSAIFYKQFNFDTLSVHLGKWDTLIELATTQISTEQLAEAEYLANDMIRHNLQVNAILVTKEEIQQYSIRRDVKYTEQPIRLICVGDFDCTGCGGIHVKSSGEVGLIKILKTEKIRNVVRVHSKIGQAAYQYFAQLHENTRQMNAAMSCSVEDIPDRISTLITENKELTKNLRILSEKWLDAYAGQLDSDELIGLFTLSDMSVEQLSRISLTWVELHNKPCFMSSERGGKRYFVLRCLKDKKKNAKHFIENSAQDFSIRGGGSQDFAQGIINLSKIDEAYIRNLKIALTKYFTN